jgi:oxygen-dependent protoporphyrinogen oxidase
VVSAVHEPASAPPIFATPIGGMARLIDALLALTPGVDIREGRRVEAIERRQAPGTDRVLIALDDGSTLDADAVIVTCPAHAAGPLLAEVAPEVSSTLTAIDHSSIAMLTMAFAGTDLGDTSGASGCLVPRDQGTLVTAISYATSKWAQLRDPERDDVILRTSVGRSGDTRFTDLDDAALTEQVLADLDRIIGVTGAPAEVRLGRWMRSFPQYAPGHVDRMAKAETALADSPVRIAGMAVRGVGIPACVRSAEEAVASLGVTWPTRRSLA